MINLPPYVALVYCGCVSTSWHGSFPNYCFFVHGIHGFSNTEFTYTECMVNRAALALMWHYCNGTVLWRQVLNGHLWQHLLSSTFNTQHLTSVLLANASAHWGRDKMAATLQATFSTEFSWMKMYQFQLKFHWSFFLRAKLTLSPHWFR